MVAVFAAACNPAPELPAPAFRLTSEEAGFLAKGALFEIYGVEADPVVVDVVTTASTFEGEPAWQLDTLVEVVIDGRNLERRWRFWVGLGEEGQPAVLETEEIG